jgi:hypothetical protein
MRHVVNTNDVVSFCPRTLVVEMPGKVQFEIAHIQLGIAKWLCSWLK